jgi:ribosomal protein L20A (L18A)
MASDPNEPQNASIAGARAIKEAAGYVMDTIKFFDDQERKQILDQVLSELGSKLVVGRAD